MASTPIPANPISSPSPSSFTSGGPVHEERAKHGVHLMRPLDEDIDFTIRPARVPSLKAVKQRIVSNTVTSCLSKCDSPNEVVWVTMRGSPEWSLTLHKANGKLSVDDMIDAYKFFSIINDTQTKNYKDVLPFLLTERTEFFQKRLWVLSKALEAMKGEWSSLEIPPSIDAEFSSSSSLVHERYPGLSPTGVLICLAFDIHAYACIRVDGVRIEKLMPNFYRMFESCHLLLRSRSILKAARGTRVAGLKSAMERLLPLSGGVDYLIQFSRETCPDHGVRWSVA